MVNWEGSIGGRQVTCALQFIDAGKAIDGQGRDDEGRSFSVQGKIKEWNEEEWDGMLVQGDL